ncbi:MAG: dihydroorotate dehydrogenase electron transfer subunit [Kiritimatiellaceae bacterium]|nr:dihydroorotate dehydrogenase electron transfer subunit [Kiritimatiellaceae bacterium]
MIQDKATVLKHENFQGDYRILHLATTGIGPHVQPGQFVHLQVPQLGDRILRRPFSIYKADSESISLLYKPVGRGTASMATLHKKSQVDLIGPLGNGYPEAANDTLPVLVAGGYGNAALYLKARSLKRKGVAFFGGRTAEDILCVEEFEALGWDVRPTTNDGSLGIKGLVTDAFDPWLLEQNERKPELFVCGPTPMLRAMGDRAIENNFKAWLSLDENMACGVGACLTCVIKQKTESGWQWARCCKDGPIFESREVLWDE